VENLEVVISEREKVENLEVVISEREKVENLKKEKVKTIGKEQIPR